eukprot:6175595-Pleurochrysis_carterae.AAC.2
MAGSSDSRALETGTPHKRILKIVIEQNSLVPRTVSPAEISQKAARTHLVRCITCLRASERHAAQREQHLR